MSNALALARVLKLVIRNRHDPANQFVVVLSPPGAGKTDLVEQVAATACVLGLRVALCCPRVEQSLDLVRRLLAAYPVQALRLWMGQDRTLPPDLLGLARLVGRGCYLFRGDQGPVIDIATVSKMAYLPDLRVDLLIVDEAAQVPFADVVPLLDRADRFVFVGDPGQLRPLVRIDTEPYQAARYRMHVPAPLELLRHVPASPVLKLRHTYRLPPDSADLVSSLFYPQLPFRSAVSARQRRVMLGQAGVHRDGLDHALDLLAGGASIVALVLPPQTGVRREVDDEVIDLIAQVVQRALTRQLAPLGAGPFQARQIGCLHPHVAAGDALRRQLQARHIPVGRMLLATPEVAQGQQRQMLVVAYPLSSAHPSDFELDPGRLCVSLSRHLYGCVVVARDGFAAALATRQHDSGRRALGSPDPVWQGRQVHESFWEQLRHRGQIVQV